MHIEDWWVGDLDSQYMEVHEEDEGWTLIDILRS